MKSLRWDTAWGAGLARAELLEKACARLVWGRRVWRGCAGCPIHSAHGLGCAAA